MKKAIKIVTALFVGVVIAAGVKTEAKADATPAQIYAYYELVNPGSMSSTYGSLANYEQQLARAYQAQVVQYQYEKQLQTLAYNMTQMAYGAAEAEQWRVLTHGTVNPYAQNWNTLNQQYQALYAQYQATMASYR